MTTQEVKSPDFSEPEARRLTIRAVLKGDLSLDGSVVMLAAVAEAQEEELTQLRATLGYVNETVRLLKEAFLEARALGCKAAWALGMTDVVGFTKRSTPTEELPGHTHELFTEEQLAALRPLAALDTRGYAPPDSDGGPNREVMGFSVGPTPEDAGTLIPGTGTGEPPVPPQYAERPA